MYVAFNLIVESDKTYYYKMYRGRVLPTYSDITIFDTNLRSLLALKIAEAHDHISILCSAAQAARLPVDVQGQGQRHGVYWGGQEADADVLIVLQQVGPGVLGVAEQQPQAA